MQKSNHAELALFFTMENTCNSSNSVVAWKQQIIEKIHLIFLAISMR